MRCTANDGCLRGFHMALDHYQFHNLEIIILNKKFERQIEFLIIYIEQLHEGHDVEFAQCTHLLEPSVLDQISPKLVRAPTLLTTLQYQQSSAIHGRISFDVIKCCTYVHSYRDHGPSIERISILTTHSCDFNCFNLFSNLVNSSSDTSSSTFATCTTSLTSSI